MIPSPLPYEHTNYVSLREETTSVTQMGFEKCKLLAKITRGDKDNDQDRSGSTSF